MLLAIDVGNTRTKAGVWSGDSWVRLESAPSSAAGFEQLVESGFAEGVEHGMCASVVPPLQAELERCFSRVRLTFLEANRPEFAQFVDYGSRSTLGADRLANAFAMLDRLKGKSAGIAVDLGTATKFDVVTFENGEGAFRGGAIMPGLAMAAESLTRGTAQLPEVALEAPARALGTDTKTCLQSGVMYGNAAAIDGLIARISGELWQAVTVFFTGGYAEHVIPLCRTQGTFAPHLTLEGLVAAHSL